ncbi:4Fe-4S dicluster domain-containing protein [Salmonella enterica subsp. enterica]|nr:4Fe-4S dicluster domain-containing protein [Salmonella enterica subsp. enterica]
MDSCMVPGFSDMAGGVVFAKNPATSATAPCIRSMTTKRATAFEHMCVGCGRCDDYRCL